MAEAQQATPHSPSPASQISHEIQLRYELAASTFKNLCKITTNPTRSDILKKACFATEFQSFPIKKGEMAFFRAINDNTGIPYPLNEYISQPWHKAFLVIQIDLLKTGWPNKLSGPARKDLHQELGRMYKLFDRLLRCLIDILGERSDGRGVCTALDVLRSLKAGVWEGSENQLLQVEGIGLAKKQKLIGANIKNIKQLSKLEFYHIERVLSRNPPFGQTMLHKLAGFPILELDFEIIGQYAPDPAATSQGLSEPREAKKVAPNTQVTSESLWIARAVLGFANESTPIWKGRTPWLTLVVEGNSGRLVWFWRGNAKRLTGKKEMLIGLSAKSGEQLSVSFACEEIVGTLVQTGVRVEVKGI
ncbi:hypothetical protein NW762_004330 [Fusarium torreyae]|uniref:SEC63 domain-containing protein n=1 Tax=Fusarium torreyae TaxID=1237075 RepID=A0A9W8VI07_9HYPO|nr:hypothetical protein NW762_004330 [Fusarium torreyae]